MTPREFIRKWRAVELKESAAAQEHFIDLCHLLGHPSPAEADPLGEDFSFEKGAEKRDGRDGFADVWKRGFFAWEYKGKHKDLDAAWQQLDQYSAALENPPLLVTCDLDRFEVHTNFTSAKHHVYRIELEELARSDRLELLKAVFLDPEKLRPGRASRVVTQDAAQMLGNLAQTLRERGVEARAVARFLDRIVFCLFAEDIRLLKDDLVTKLLERSRGEPAKFGAMIRDLFARMATGGTFGFTVVPHVNGRLFDDDDALDLRPRELEMLYQASRLDWSAIDPTIFGTLFVRGMDESKRSQLGAQYTSREDIETLVEPVVMTPLRRDWAETKAAAERKLEGKGKAAQRDAWAVLDSFLSRLEAIRILDPACGSGNFLYVALQKIKDLELEVTDFALDHGLTAPVHVGFGPWALYGIEIDAYAHELAQMTVWIGYLQWLWRHGNTSWREPVLQAMSNIECKDAILDLSDPENPKEPEWPAVDFIIGNPPFLGDKLMRGELGDAYVEALRTLYEGRVSRQADLCCWWFERALAELGRGHAKRIGLLATQAIRGGASRETLGRIKDAGDIFWAESDRPWILEGANVHVSMVGFDDGTEGGRTLDAKPVGEIHANLSAGPDTTSARTLHEAQGIAFQGITPAGPFILDEAKALELLTAPCVNGKPASDVLRPYVNAAFITGRRQQEWLIDFGVDTEESVAAGYDPVFELAKKTVQPFRATAKSSIRDERWWLHLWVRHGLRMGIRALPQGRYLATPRVAKHRVFVWAHAPALVSDACFGFVRDDDYSFGVLHSRVHQVWALKQGTQLEDRPRYTPKTCFETFPFPRPAAGLESAIADAASALGRSRESWLNPPDWTKEEALEFPGSTAGPWARYVVQPDALSFGTVRWPRVVARDEEAGEKLAKRTLTKLYNERPAWLVNAHRELDEAVFGAYGWAPDLTEEQLLERLLALNRERAGGH